MRLQTHDTVISTDTNFIFLKTPDPVLRFIIYLQSHLAEPSSCSEYTRGKSITRNLSTKYLNEIYELLRVNIANLGSCYNLIKEIYHQAEHDHQNEVTQFFESIEADEDSFIGKAPLN